MKVMIKDQEIKLFGMIITLPYDKVVYDVSGQKQSSLAASTSQDSKDESGVELVGSKQNVDSIAVAEVEGNSLLSEKLASENNEPVESNASQEKTLSKPDKLLPCPRCNSMETKFCYYNNYNVGQPRYFCKKCQRYWTAGGSMRNVPVGSGRRKSKHASAPSYRNIMVSDSLQNGIQYSPSPNGFLIFGSVTSALNPAERTQNRGEGIEFYDPSVGSSSVTSNSTIKGSDEDVLNSPTSFVPSCTYPVTFYPASPYWGCAVPSTWNSPLLCPTASSADCSTVGAGLSSSTLGKHSLDGTMLTPSNSCTKISDRCILTPKTLRIDDPNEAAKSSIWSSLGIKHQKIDPTNGASFFNAFHSREDRNMSMNNSTQVLQANPAALSRALGFRESIKCD